MSRNPPGDFARLERTAEAACIHAVARALSDDEDDALTSPRRDATLERLGVTTVRRGRR